MAWSKSWTYAIVEDFLLTAEALALDQDHSIEELQNLFKVITLTGYDLTKAAKIIEEHYDRGLKNAMDQTSN